LAAIGLFDFLPVGVLVLSGCLISGSATLATFAFCGFSSTFFSSFGGGFCTGYCLFPLPFPPF